MYKGALQYSKLTVFLFRFFFFFFFFFLQNDVEAPVYLRTPGYAPENGHHLFYNFVAWSSSIQTFDARAGRKQTKQTL